VYLQYQQIANINWDKLQTISENTLTTLANATQQIPGFDGNDNIPAELVMTNLGTSDIGKVVAKRLENMGHAVRRVSCTSGVSIDNEKALRSHVSGRQLKDQDHIQG
jgi:hypothetical protein